MSRHNTSARYGSVAKGFHWLTALLILTLLPLGWIASDLAHQVQAAGAPDAELVARTATLFSLHKTLGVTLFFVALARIAWALGQAKPGLLNGDRRAEAFAAELVHWLLYGSLVMVPLSGWVHHAATTGFAPIWWPFGQSLPFVPKSDAVAHLSEVLHVLLMWVLTGALALHVAGALKHHLIDRDATLRRMLPGSGAGQPTAAQPGHALPLLGALAVWAVVLGGAAAQGWFAPRDHGAAAPAMQAAEGGNWRVADGTLEIAVQQMGSEVTGRFADWTAEITYDDNAPGDGPRGHVRVEIAIASLSLGSVTDQALGADFLAASEFPTALFEADLELRDGQHVAAGTLTIRGISLPVEMPFELDIADDTATASGGLGVDRRDFGVGAGMSDESSLGFGVEIRFDLEANRAG